MRYMKKKPAKFRRIRFTKIRGEKISMIFQEPMTSLKPLYIILKNKSLNVFTVDQKSNKSKCINLLKEVGLKIQK